MEEGEGWPQEGHPAEILLQRIPADWCEHGEISIIFIQHLFSMLIWVGWFDRRGGEMPSIHVRFDVVSTVEWPKCQPLYSMHWVLLHNMGTGVYTWHQNPQACKVRNARLKRDARNMTVYKDDHAFAYLGMSPQARYLPGFLVSCHPPPLTHLLIHEAQHLNIISHHFVTHLPGSTPCTCSFHN